MCDFPLPKQIVMEETFAPPLRFCLAVEYFFERTFTANA